MIDSAVLENYAPVIVPLTFIYGLRSVIQSIPLGGVELIGIIFMLGSLLIYYDRVADANRDVFGFGLGLFIVSYLGIRMVRSIWLLCLMTAALVMIGRGVLDVADFSAHAQRVYLALLLLFVGFVFTLIENNSLPPYPIALLVNAVGITILTLSTVELPKA